ncbi:MAG: hypothetical protein QTN59_00240 [Candidatus Electrothrix communis]|nr:MAG: hypothetical protein QTN59_00240 [Candidatus Electrothrix communis]
MELDEYEVSFPVHVWEQILYEGLKEIVIDVYYTEGGFPKEIHDEFGTESVESFRVMLVEMIKSKNNCNDIWRLSSDGFAVKHKSGNCSRFELVYKNIQIKILKKTVTISTKKLQEKSHKGSSCG